MSGMEYGILDCFMISFVCGLIFGLVYEFFRLIRRIFDYKAVIFICDVCFFIAAGFFVFQLSMYLGNYIRMYTLLGFGGGIFAYIQTLGRLISLLEELILRVLRTVFGRFFAFIARGVRKAVGAFAHNISAAFGRFYDFFRKKKKSAASLLHSNGKRVYNVKRNIIQSGENIGGKNVIQAKIRRSP